MLPYNLLDSARVQDGTIRLYQRGDEFSIRVDKQGELMNSRAHNSEDILAKLACDHLSGHASPHLLVGGLGMGFTLRAALAHSKPTARITVAELVPAVVRWNRDYLGELAGFPLNDDRVIVLEQDVGKVMHDHKNGFDAIMLDVDNGPDAFTREDNDSLYGYPGLDNAYEALRPGGVLTVWSAAPDAGFMQRMRKVGFDVEEQRAWALPNQRQGNRHTIWIGIKPAR